MREWCGRARAISRKTVRPPTPESKIPIGEAGGEAGTRDEGRGERRRCVATFVPPPSPFTLHPSLFSSAAAIVPPPSRLMLYCSIFLYRFERGVSIASEIGRAHV